MIGKEHRGRLLNSTGNAPTRVELEWFRAIFLNVTYFIWYFTNTTQCGGEKLPAIWLDR